MITRTMLTDQLDLYHARLEMALEGITGEDARRVVAKPLAPIVWQIGHLAVVDAIYVQRGGGSYTVQPSYDTLFKPGTGGEAEYPLLGEVWAAFSDAHQALRALVKEADLARPLQHPAGAYTSVGGMLLYACYHRGYHAGKIGTLRALLGKPLPMVPPARR
ncbi:MAG TPA: DinB family protein [bacterium]|nr:DinB family protein [bacterium]